jgi:hypothetical protein
VLKNIGTVYEWEPDRFVYRAGPVPPGTGRTGPVPNGFVNPAPYAALKESLGWWLSRLNLAASALTSQSSSLRAQ